MFHGALKTYGKEAESLEDVQKLFLFALAEYPVQKIVDAFAYYTKYFNEFPAPSDIVCIIERGNKPPFERSVYIGITKKPPDQRTREEWQYLREYEDFMING